MHDVPAWRLGREQGHPLCELAELYEVPEHLIGVALDGWPDPSPAPEDVAGEALQLWRDGADLDDIAAQLEVPPARLRRWVQDGSVRLTPDRLRTSQILERFGWSHHMAALYREADPDLDTPCRVSIAGYKLANEGEPGTVGLNIVVAPVLEEHRP